MGDKNSHSDECKISRPRSSGDEYPEEWIGIENKKTGHIYDSDEFWKYMLELKHPFHETLEEFEVYECPDCEGHFMVECDAVSSVSVIYCPYCKTPFYEKKVV